MVLSTSATCNDPILQRVREAVAAPRLLQAGGSANKVLSVVLGRADAALLNLATSKWDSCATEAVLGAAGGTVTTLLGWPIEHAKKAPTANRLGVLCTGARYEAVGGRTHADLCRALRADLEIVTGLLRGRDLRLAPGEGAAVDLARGIDGEFFTAAELSEAIFGRPGCVAGYRVPEGESMRYKQSHGCRIHLDLHPEAAPRDGPRSAFYKWIVLRELPYAMFKHRTVPFKLGRDVQANRVEATVLSSPALRAFHAANSPGVQVALPYRTEQRVYPDTPVDSRFGLLLRDFHPREGWRQCAHLGRERMEAALRALARFHAFFWLGPRGEGSKGDPLAEPKASLSPNLWEVGCYWDLAKQPEDQVGSLPARWARLLEAFGGKGLAPEEVGGMRSVGPRLERVAREVAAKVHGHRQTVIHGDAKIANFFFRDGPEGGGVPEVGLIDFQWSGPGLAAVDVSYCIWASASLELLGGEVEAGGGEAGLVEAYHSSLVKALEAAGFAGEEIPPLATFEGEYELALLDLARVVVGEHWKTATPESLEARRGELTFAAYNKCPSLACCLMRRVADALKRYEGSG